MEAIGSCSSRDKFFAWDKRAGENGEYKQLSDVDETNIQKAAYSNMVMNGVTRLLGIRNLSWDELREITGDGVKEDKVDHAEFKRGKGGGVSGGNKERMAEPEQRSRVWRDWCAAMRYDENALPDDAGKRFYDWVVMVLGNDKKRDRELWSEADAKKLVAKAELLKEAGPGGMDAPDAPAAPEPEDAPPA